MGEEKEVRNLGLNGLHMSIRKVEHGASLDLHAATGLLEICNHNTGLTPYQQQVVWRGLEIRRITKDASLIPISQQRSKLCCTF